MSIVKREGNKITVNLTFPLLSWMLVWTGLWLWFDKTWMLSLALVPLVIILVFFIIFIVGAILAIVVALATGKEVKFTRRR